MLDDNLGIEHTHSFVLDENLGTETKVLCSDSFGAGSLRLS